MTTSYAVLVQQVFNVRLAIRRVLQYALARYVILSAVSAPVLILAFSVYGRREESLSILATDSNLQFWAAVSGFGVLVYRFRWQLLRSLERRFFLEPHDSQRSLMRLVEEVRLVATVRECADLLVREIDRVLHPETVKVFLNDPDRAEFRTPDGSAPSLPASSWIVARLAGSSQPLAIQPLDLLMRTEETDETSVWLRSIQCELLLPLLDSTGAVVGLTTIGPKRNELPFSTEDRAFLSAICVSAAMALENLNRRTVGEKAMATDGSYNQSELAQRCVACGKIVQMGTSACSVCGGAVSTIGLPYIVAHKFRLESEIGAGGMGVVYRAVDLDLGREVAIKSLPMVSPDSSMRLRNEARAMASVTHPNLALVFAAEEWCGIPLLVLEYFQKGTLANRIESGVMLPVEVARMGVALADALERIHRAGILHRDIKPRNIGFTSDGIPKLMDFGLAKFLSDGREERFSMAGPHHISTLPLGNLLTGTATGHIVGTPAYMSPEAALGDAPDVSCDLWSLGITLFEALVGHNPMVRPSVADTLEVVRGGGVPGAQVMRPDCPPSLCRILDDTLSGNRNRRPTSARQMGEMLEDVLGRLG